MNWMVANALARKIVIARLPRQARFLPDFHTGKVVRLGQVESRHSRRAATIKCKSNFPETGLKRLHKIQAAACG